MNQRLCVYVAGAYSADNVLDVLNNIRHGLEWSKKVWLAGHAPFCPWADMLLALKLIDEEQSSMTVQDYYDASESWLRKADALLVTPFPKIARASRRRLNRQNFAAFLFFTIWTH